MSLRETLNKRPILTAGIVLCMVGSAVGLMLWPESRPEAPPRPTQMYFSTDDGKTWFGDDVRKIAPFEKDGKQAVLVHLYRCGKGEPFVGYLERMTPEAKRIRERREAAMASGGAGAAQGPHAKTMTDGLAIAQGVEVKRPGEAQWVRMLSPAGQQIRAAKCPEGGEPQPVLP